VRVTIVGINYGPETTGVAPYSTAIAEGLASRGHQVHMITGLPHYPEWRVADDYRHIRRADTGLNGVGLHRRRHFVPSTASARGRIRMEVSFARSVLFSRWFSPDVVLVVTPALLSAAAVVARARVLGIPVGVVVQDVYGTGVVETGAMGGRAAAQVARLETSVLNGATSVSVIHRRLARVLTDAGVDNAKLRVIRNWAHIEGGVQLGGNESARVRLGWKPDETVVLHAGNMGAKQGLENVVAAARLAAADDQAPRVRFVLLGNGNKRRAIEELAAGVPTLDIVDSLPDAEFRAALAAADILLVNELPGIGDMAVPSKLTSYFIAGKPIIAATDAASGSADELESSGAGVVVPPGDPQRLLDTVRRVAADQRLRENLGRNGMRYAEEVLSADSALNAYEAWCAELASRGGRRRATADAKSDGA
jgi:glycosyltransferase involved in cell wall biosynthesis